MLNSKRGHDYSIYKLHSYVYDELGSAYTDYMDVGRKSGMAQKGERKIDTRRNETKSNQTKETKSSHSVSKTEM